jgi:hypothetical protein
MLQNFWEKVANLMQAAARRCLSAARAKQVLSSESGCRCDPQQPRDCNAGSNRPRDALAVRREQLGGDCRGNESHGSEIHGADGSFVNGGEICVDGGLSQI